MFLRRLCFSAVRLSLYVRLSERLESIVQSHCLGAQMHIQSCVLCSLNSVNPSAVPKLKTQASPVFLPLSRIFTLSRRASSQHNFHWKPSSSSFSLSVLSCWLTAAVFDKTHTKVFFKELQKRIFFYFGPYFFSQKNVFSDILSQSKGKCYIRSYF